MYLCLELKFLALIVLYTCTIITVIMRALLIVFYTEIGNPFLKKLLLLSLLFLKVYTKISHFPILSMFI